MTTVASYFFLNMGSTEREAEAAITCIRSDFFRVANLQGIGFADVSKKPIQVPDPDKRPADLTYFIFRFVVSAVATTKRTLDKYLSLEFSFRLPQTFAHHAHFIGPPSVTTATTSPMTIESQPLFDFSAKLGGFSDVSFDKLRVTELPALLADADILISLPAATPI